MKRQNESNRQDLIFSNEWPGTLPREQRKSLGQWATPWWIVKACMDQHDHDLPSRPIIVDPCCGDGRWLVAAAQRHPDARLYGYDIDSEMVSLAKRTLTRHGVTAHLETANTLEENHSMPKADLVIGNPPFVRPQNLPKKIRRDLWRRFYTATNKADLYACFVERALSISKRVLFVLPENWLYLSSFYALREFVRRAGVNGIYQLDSKAFSGVSVSCVVAVFGPEKRALCGELRAETESFHVTETLRMSADAWSTQGPLPQLPGTALGEFATLHMGIVCGDYDRYVVSQKTHSADMPTCRGRDVLPWSIREPYEYVRYLPADMLARKPYVAPKHSGLFEVPEKVIIAGTSGLELRAAMDTMQRYPLDSCYLMHAKNPKIDLWGLLGFLLSRPVGDWYGKRHRAARVKAVELRRIPIPRLPWTDVAEAARQRDHSALDKAVTQLYERDREEERLRLVSSALPSTSALLT